MDENEKTEEFKPCCGNCYYWCHSDGTLLDSCHRNAPKGHREWPYVKREDWCGLYVWSDYGTAAAEGKHEAQQEELDNLAEEIAANAKTREEQGASE